MLQKLDGRPHRRRHDLPPPKGLFLQESSLHQLLRIPTFFCLLKVKGTTNRIVGAYGPRDKFSTFSSMRRRLIRLLRYSTFGRTSSPYLKRIFPVHETTTYSTTLVLNLRRDKFPISQEDFFVHETTIDRLYTTFGGTNSLSPKRISSSMRWQLIDYFGTRPLKGQVSISPRT